MRYWTNRTNPSRGLMPLLMLCALMLCGLNVRAGTLTVSSTADSGAGTLRDQVAAAAPGDTIDFNVTGTITLTSGVIAINKDLNITGPGASSLAVSISPTYGYAASIFSISSGIVGLSGLTLSNGSGTSIWTYNTATGTYGWREFGGAIYMTGGTVTIAGTTISSNHAVDGGAIYMTGGTLAVTGSTLSNNDARANNGLGGAIDMTGDSSLAVTSSTISNNVAALGGGIFNGSTVTIMNSTLSGNRAKDDLDVGFGRGGGIFNVGTVTIRNSTISGNTAEGVGNSSSHLMGGGGIQNQGSLTVANCTITGNQGQHGGGINSLLAGSLHLTNSIVASNSGEFDPDLSGPDSGTYNVTGQDPKLGPLANNGGLTLTHALLPGSPALDAGDPNFDPTNTPYDQRGPGFPRIKNGRVCIGALESEVNQSGSSVIVNTLEDHDDGTAGPTDSTLREAVKYASAGATITFSVAGIITLTGGEMVITNNLTIIGPTNAPGITVSGNNASRIFTVTRGTVNFSTLTLSGGNGAGSTNSGNGGAIYIDTFTPPMIVTVTNCTLSGNHATSNGGAIRNGGTLTVTSSTLSSNSATLNAGAIQNGSTLAVLTVTSSTFSGNSATGTGVNGIGGAIRNFGNLAVTSCTFSGNSASLRGGGIDINTGTSTLTNTIVAGNSAPTGLDITGTVTAGDYNLVQNTAGATLPGTHNITGQPALLGPLANNGGPTQTHALLSGSPALDAGDPGFDGTGLTDQRGQPRLSGLRVDIGAVEQGILAGGSPLLTSPTTLGTGSFQFIFTSTPSASLTVWASTNVALPFNQWSNLGAPVESPAGTFTFTDPQATNNAIRFYRVSSP